MVKTRENLRQIAKARRNKYREANKNLKVSRNWYPTTDSKVQFRRKSRVPRPTRLRKDIQPGQVVIILSGRFRGRRVVFLRQLPSGLLLVTGPYKLNGVPLKRVNQAYVIPTQTRVNLGNVPGLDKINDNFFTTRVNIKRGTDFFEDPKKKKERITEERRNAQNTVDTEVTKAVRATPLLREYLQNRFALKNGDRPHLMQF